MSTDMDCIDIEIHDIGYGGDGVGRLPDGRVVFVPFTAVGDRVRVELVGQRKRFARGEVRELLTPGPGRTIPRCPVYGRCGGCQYQHLDADTELAAKTEQLEALLTRLGKRDDLPDVEVFDSPDVYHYRNRIRLRHGRRGWGYFALDNRTIIPIDHCPLALPEVNAKIADLPVSGTEPVEVWADGPYTLFGREVELPPESFYQVNQGVLERLARWLRALFAAAPAPHLVDAYCGVGVFSLALGEYCAEITGIEDNRDAVLAARVNAENWELGNVKFFAGPTEELLHDHLRPESVVLLDPPRGGCEPEVMVLLQRSLAPRIIYISCNPSMLARDLGVLGAEYRIDRLALFNMFPQTAHFETVAVLERRAVL